SRRIHDRHLCHMPPHPGYVGIRRVRTGPHSHRQPPHDRRRLGAQHEGDIDRLARRSAAAEAGRAHARHRSPGRDTPRARPLPRAAALMTRHLIATETRSPEQPKDPLTQAWSAPGGFLGWFTHVNHRSIGRRFIFTAFVFFLLGGIEALLMRIQLGSPENTFISPDLYNQLFTMHGTTMMFFFAVPVMEGMGMFLVPLMLGTRDAPFPRMNAFGYYTYLIAGVVLYAAFLMNMGPDAGWFAYPPLSGPEFSPGLRMDFWATMVTFIELSALVAAVELITLIFKQRAPGMSLNRMPVFAWAILVMSFMIMFAMPPLIVGSVFLAMDRSAGTFFFGPVGGGH